jgi:serine/threonine protein kinase/tetratricopeptide (TPR) repeat protein
MTPSDPYWRVKHLFIEAVEKAPVEREAFLRDTCGDDVQLLEEITAMLAAHDHAGGMLAKPTFEHQLRRSAVSSEQPGDVIGVYKLLQQIGEGGFGTVYLAEQEHPVRRRVALKIIKLGMDTRQVIARFEAERQALAIMDHAGIAKVFDAGATDTGRPYFVMELVNGIPITDYCDKQSLRIAERLELFVQVCQAVQHAHQKGLIHRDLKPSNVLVSTQDDRPVARVIDFGIAKATQARLTEKTLFTEFRQLIGTPEYMSPEQAESSLDIDTRSDVYSLGVLLYELLTGTTPFDAKELRSKAYAEIQRIIREVEPPRPSTRLSQNTDTIAGVAAHRHTEPRKLSASVRGELDWIVMKCLEKDRARRYETASSLAADIRHHLADEPVSAAAPSSAYRLRKTVRRNKGPVVASATVFIVLVAGIIGTTIGLIGQSRQRAIAEQQRAEAERQRQEAQNQEKESDKLAAIAIAVSKFQGDMFASARPSASGDKVTVLEVMMSAVKELDAGKLKDQPLAEANVREMIGDTLSGLGRESEAEPHLRKSLELRRSALAAPHWGIAQSIQTLAITLGELGQLPEAESLMREALAMRRAVLPAGHTDIAETLTHLGFVLQVVGKYAEAEIMCREAVDMDRKQYPAGHMNITYSLAKLGWLLQVEGKFDEAELVCREALEIRRRNLPAVHPDIAESLNHLAVVLARTDRLAQAEPLFREMLEIDRKSLPAGHPRIGQSVNNLARALQDQGKLAEAEPLQREGLEMRRESLPAGHPYIAQSLKNLAELLREQGKFAEAEPLAREALAIRRSALPAGHPDTADILYNLGLLLKDQAKFAEAEAALTEAEQIYIGAEGIPATNHDDCVEALVGLYSDWNQSEPGKGYDARAAHWRAKLPTTQPATTSTSRP